MITQIATGPRFSDALTSAGKLLAWGDNREGELGIGAASNGTLVPVSVAMPAGTTVTSVAAGRGHTLAVTSTGAVYGWGENSYGELGNGTRSPFVATPTLVKLPAGTTATAVAIGEFYSLALTSTGAVLAWGLNGHGQLGNGTRDQTAVSTTPVVVTMPSGTIIDAIGAGDHSVALTSTGKLLTWGDNGNGQLGNGLVNHSGSPVPVAVTMPAGTTATAVADDSGHTLALLADGRILAWGIDAAGQLGDGTPAPFRATPVFVALPTGTTAVAIATGGQDGFAVTASGGILGWGSNTSGVLGDGTTTNRPAPVPVALAAGLTASAVAAGGQHAMAIVS